VSVRGATDARRSSIVVRLTVAIAVGISILIAVALVAQGARGARDQAILVVGTIAYLVVAALIVERRPGNAIGPTLLVLGLYLACYVGADWYIRQPGPQPGASILAWLVSASDGPGFALVGVIILAFPDGDLPSRRWRPALWLAGVEAVLIAIGATFQVGPLTYYPQINAPFGIPGFPGLAFLYAGYAGVATLLLLAAASLVIRWRKAGIVGRAQLKWVAMAAALLAITQLGLEVTAAPRGDVAPGPSNLNELAVFASIVAFSLFPVAIGIAVLRYRLYEIDRIISRSLAYAVLTALLVAVYLVGFAILQAALVPFTHGGGAIAVAASTLAVFALLQPLRRRVQRTMDRRFNRSRYDAERIVAAFATHLRDTVEVDPLRTELSAAIGRTVQPTTLAVWLRAPAGDGR